MTKLNLSIAERFALIDHYKPEDAQVCSAFNMTQDELDTARMMRDAGAIPMPKNLDVAQYAHVFSTDPNAQQAVTSVPTIGKTNKNTKSGGATTHARPESASKRPKVQQKRGRKGSKIATALQAVTDTPVRLDTFLATHGVSAAVMRQSKRFIETLEPEVQKRIGRVNVRQDSTTKQLMIWREDV